MGIGVTFSRDKVTGHYVVKRVVDGGSAWRCRKVRQGDIFYEVDGVSVCFIDPEGLRRFRVLKPMLHLLYKLKLSCCCQAHFRHSRKSDLFDFGKRWKESYGFDRTSSNR